MWRRLMSKKGRAKVTMTTKKGHQNFRRKTCKPSCVTELRHFFNPALTNGYQTPSA